MRTRIICSLAVVTLVLSACGGGASGKQGEVADLLIESATEAGVELDNGCVNDVASKLSDEDAEKMVEAGVDGDADVSLEAEALAFEMLDCVDGDALIDTMIEQIGDEADADCLRQILEGVEPSALASGDLPDGILECMNVGG